MWDKMEIFYHVVKAGSFTKAEKVLHKSQSALSRSVLILEERLGVKLLDRRHSGLVLTRKGEDVFNTAQKMLMDMSGLKALMDEPLEMSGKIRLSSTHALVNYILSPMIIAFQKKYPGIHFDIYCNDETIDIIQNEVDIAVRPFESDSKEVVHEHFFNLQANLYASQAYIDKYGEPKSVKDLVNHKFIAFSRPDVLPYADVEWFLRANKPEEQDGLCVLRVNSIEMIFEAARAGVGIISSYDSFSIVKKSGFKKILPDFKGPKYEEFFVHPKHLSSLKRIQVFKEFAMEYLRHDPSLKDSKESLS